MIEPDVVAAEGGSSSTARGGASETCVEPAGAGGPAGSAGAPSKRRRQANVVGGRSRAVLVRVSEAEAQMLAERAEQVGVSVPRLLVEAAMASGGPAGVDRRAAMEELFAVHRVLSGIAAGVNEMAKVTNATRQAPEGRAWMAALGSVRVVASRLDEVLAAISSGQKAVRRR